MFSPCMSSRRYRGRAWGPPPYFGQKKEEMIEWRKDSRASKSKLGTPLSSRSRSATDEETIWGNVNFEIL